jgi:translation initiation factor IF-3
MEMAYGKNLDLVKISPTASPPVCKIMNYGKYKFEAIKKDKEHKKRQKSENIKEIRITQNIGEHDLNTKIENIIKFLKMGYKVKITIRFRGREITHSSIGISLIEEISKKVLEYGSPEKNPKLEGKFLSVVIGSKKNLSATEQPQ